MTAEHTLVRAKVDEVAAKVIDGEAVLINLATGVYYSMRGSGAYLWSQLEPGSTLSRLGDIVAIRYGIDPELAQRDVQRLVAELHAEGLVTLDEGPAGQALAVTAEAERGTDAYETPQLEKFDDMADMFALDPPLPELPAVGGAGRP